MVTSIKQTHPHKDYKSTVLLIKLKEKLAMKLTTISKTHLNQNNHTNCNVNQKNKYPSSEAKAVLKT
jgi:hypothetical protein